jgi:hypothetical protein
MPMTTDKDTLERMPVLRAWQASRHQSGPFQVPEYEDFAAIVQEHEALAREVIALREAAAKVEEILTSAMIEHDTADYGPGAENPWTMQEWFSDDDREALDTLRTVLGESE